MPNQGKKNDVHAGAAKKAQRKDVAPKQKEQAQETKRPPVSDRALPEEKAFRNVPTGVLSDERLADTDEMAQTGHEAEAENQDK